jgi:FKBP-type peptidyl-prolyl cis-trans isomerase
MNKTIAISIVVALVAIGLVYWMVKSGTSTDQTQSNINQTLSMEGLKIEDLTVGTGAEAKDGNLVTVNYLGTLDNGTKFDSSYDRKQPFQFILGAGMVIPGWDQGVKGMKVGGKRRLAIPPNLGYGAQAVGPIPANSTLHFDVELLEVKATAGGQ